LSNQLRQKCIEAGRKAILAKQKRWLREADDEWLVDAFLLSEVALDAHLSVLADNADEFKPATFQLCVEDVVAVLRNGRTDE
jgi:hypothetical protein